MRMIPYRVTKYMALDCEMDLNTTGMTKTEQEAGTAFTTKNPGLALKVSLVNQHGETVLDTLVDYTRVQLYVPAQEVRTGSSREGLRSKSTGKASKDARPEEHKHSESEPLSKPANSSRRKRVGLKRRHSDRDTSEEADAACDQLVLELQRQVVRRKNIEAKSMSHIHGIPASILRGAPTVEQVRSHIVQLFQAFKEESGEEVVLVGHSVVNDIEALRLESANYIDTTNFKFKSCQQGQVKKLVHLAESFLAIKYPADMHSSLADARVAMALFLKFKDDEEGFYADKTTRQYQKSQRVKEMETRANALQKKRVKKVHRKDLLKKLEMHRDGAGSTKARSEILSQRLLDSSWQLAKLAVYSLGVYSVQYFANQQFQGQIPGVLDLLK